jgi:threonine/homoserine/homoserine lactone efflux protein
MLPLEAIAVLGLIYLLFMYGMLRATRVEKRERERRRAWDLPTQTIP